MKRVVILTGSELRHHYFRLKVASDPQIEVMASYCESEDRSLKNRTYAKASTSDMEKLHVLAREQSESDFFREAVDTMPDKSKPTFIRKGTINDQEVVDDIIRNAPDIVVCYGSSLVRSSLLSAFKGRFLNVHLGLSPYYRGSGTNVWPLINGQPDMVGATFMHIDEGIDTGEIIHQIRAEMFLGDSPHSIGNRLIRRMTETYCKLIAAFDRLEKTSQPEAEGQLYLQKDFTADACASLYKQCQSDLIANYIMRTDYSSLPHIVQNAALRE